MRPFQCTTSHASRLLQNCACLHRRQYPNANGGSLMQIGLMNARLKTCSAANAGALAAAEVPRSIFSQTRHFSSGALGSQVDASRVISHAPHVKYCIARECIRSYKLFINRHTSHVTRHTSHFHPHVPTSTVIEGYFPGGFRRVSSLYVFGVVELLLSVFY